MSSVTAIVLLDGPRGRSPASSESLVMTKRHVAPMYKMPMDVRYLSLMPSSCGVSCVL